jgi:DNA polymerase/3'-5' exonuclease PolX
MSTQTKRPYSEVMPIALRLVEALRPYCQRIELAGSLRRQREMIGDIEVVAVPLPRTDLFGTPIKGPTPLDAFLAEKNVEFTKKGDRYKQFAYGPYTVDLFLPTLATWGSVFTIRTGSWQFSRWLVTREAIGGACPFGVTFGNEDDGAGRLYAHGRRLATPEEADVFAAVGLAFIEPPLRDGPIADPVRVEPAWKFG